MDVTRLEAISEEEREALLGLSPAEVREVIRRARAKGRVWLRKANQFRSGAMRKINLGTINEEKVQRYMDLVEANIEEEMKPGGVDKWLRPLPPPRPNYRLESAWCNELSWAEQEEVCRRKKIKAREAGEAIEYLLRWFWGGE
jgi:hypothetical protein